MCYHVQLKINVEAGDSLRLNSISQYFWSICSHESPFRMHLIGIEFAALISQWYFLFAAV